MIQGLLLALKYLVLKSAASYKIMRRIKNAKPQIETLRG
jgi:hypothetical protein